MKQLSAILFSLLLVLAQLSAAPAPVAATRLVHAGCHCGGAMSCCAAQAPSGSQPAPAIPSNSSVQNQLSLLTPAVVVWALPETALVPVSFASGLSLNTTGARLYARDCARLI